MRAYSMELLILDNTLTSSAVVDVYKSLIWTDRYFQCSDFEIAMTASEHMIRQFKNDYYVLSKSSEHVMIVEEIRIESNPDEGDQLIVSGRSLESILDRRIIWNYTEFSGSFQDGIEKLLNENVINPSDNSRKIQNMVFKRSEDPRILELKTDYKYYGHNLYDAIETLCKEKKLGFKIVLDGTNFVFSLYYGTDRSYEQLVNPYIVFSPKYENIIESNYVKSLTGYRTVTLVSDGNVKEPVTTTVAVKDGAGSGMTRREMFTMATHEDTVEQMKQAGTEDLDKNSDTGAFDGKIESTNMYAYNRDFFIGDIVQIQNAYGITARSRIVEFIMNYSDEGFESYPSLDVVK